jgi:PPM family protein phosphatase
MEEPKKKAPTLVGAFAEWRVITHKGLTRVQNEDSHCVAHRIEHKNEDQSVSRYLFAVADGLGGHKGGALASRIALKSLQEDFYAWGGGGGDHLVGKAFQHANQEVFLTAQAQGGELGKMQTTLTAAVLENDSLVVGHVGDCRIYRVRKGRINVLTNDHTMATDLLKLRLITTKQAENHPGRHQLTRSVGGEPFLRTDIIREQIQPDDIYLICSDGLWGQITDEDIEGALEEENIDTSCDKLVRLALNAGAPDNITAIVFRVIAIGKQSDGPISLRNILLRRN